MTFATEADIDTAILVVSDSLRADIKDSAMPTVNRLSRDHASFSAFFTPGASTPSSMPGFVQSRSPIDHRGYGLSLPSEIPTLAEVLNEKGVECAGWHSNVYISEKYGYDRGFEIYRDLLNSDRDGEDTRTTKSWKDTARTVADTLGLQDFAERAYEEVKRRGIATPSSKVRAERLVDDCLEWLPSSPDGKRRFGYLHLMDTHLPYLPTRPYRPKVGGNPVRIKRMYDLWKMLIEDPDSLTDNDVTLLRSLYEAEARYVDAQLERLIDILRDRDLWESTGLMFTADHGELFRDREVPDNPNLKHPDYLCYELTHTPLIVAGDDIPSLDIDTLASGLDIAPTVATMFKASIPTEWKGTILDSRAYHDREYVVSGLAHAYGKGTGARVEREAIHVAIRTDNIAMLWWLNDRFPSEFYVRTERGETPIEPDEGDERFAGAEEIAKQYAELYTDVTDRGDRGSDVSQRLRDLGYVE